MKRASLNDWKETTTALLKTVVIVPFLIAFVIQLQCFDLPLRVSKSQTTEFEEGKRIERVSETTEAPKQFRTVMMATYGVPTLVGLVSLLSQFLFRKLNHVTTILCFGFAAFSLVVDVMSGFLFYSFSDYCFAILLFAACVVGIVVETIRQRGEQD